MRDWIVRVLALLCLTINTGFAAQTWQSLDATQQQALAPLAQQWNTFSDKQQRALLLVAKRYPTLTPTEKQRLQKKLTAWSKLTPEQRKAAREKYRTLSQNPAAKDAHAKRLTKQKLAPPPIAHSGVASSVAVTPVSTVEPTIKN